MSSSPPAITGNTTFRLTRAGWLFLAVSMVIGFAGAKHAAAVMLMVFGLMLGAIVFSAVLARAMLRRIEIARDLPDRDWQYRTVHLGYYLHNRGHAPCLGLEVEEIAPEGLDSAPAYCVHLPARSSFRLGARFVAKRRGRIRLPGTALRTVFPFGLVAAVRRISMPATIVIWPARGALKRRLLHHGAVESSSTAPSQASGGQDEFFGLREYRPGDNPRWIHWKRSATRASTIIREMVRPRPETLWVLLDTYEPAGQRPPHNREKMLRFASTLIDHAFARGYRVGLAAAYADGPRVLPPGPGRGRRVALLDALVDVDENAHRPLTETLDALGKRQLREAQVILAGDEPGPAKGHPVLSSAGHVTVVSRCELARLFADAPAARGEDARCRS